MSDETLFPDLEQTRWQETLAAIESVAQGRVVPGDAVHAWLASLGSPDELLHRHADHRASLPARRLPPPLRRHGRRGRRLRRHPRPHRLLPPRRRPARRHRRAARRRTAASGASRTRARARAVASCTCSRRAPRRAARPRPRRHDGRGRARLGSPPRPHAHAHLPAPRGLGAALRRHGRADRAPTRAGSTSTRRTRSTRTP